MSMNGHVPFAQPDRFTKVEVPHGQQRAIKLAKCDEKVVLAGTRGAVPATKKNAFGALCQGGVAVALDMEREPIW